MAYCYDAGEAALCPATLGACEALCICKGGGSHSSSKEHMSKGTPPQPMQNPNLLKGCSLLPALTQGLADAAGARAESAPLVPPSCSRKSKKPVRHTFLPACMVVAGSASTLGLLFFARKMSNNPPHVFQQVFWGKTSAVSHSGMPQVLCTTCSGTIK